MIDLKVLIEINGLNVQVGNIYGKTTKDARFRYADDYLCNKENKAISLSLPLNEVEFDPMRTKNYFEGLLPEGFTRRCVAKWIHSDAEDYISILKELGKECLGAVKIASNDDPDVLPDYKLLDKSQVEKLAREGASEAVDIVTKSHLSLTGASGKVGLYLDKENNAWYRPIGSAPSTHILKQSHVRLERIVTNEQLCLLTAKKLGIEVPESFIIRSEENDADTLLFATERYDRKISDNARRINDLILPYRLHQEDFAQALGVPAADKYEKNNAHYLKRAFDLLLKYSANPLTDQLKLWDICIFNYLVGNTDNHIKNLSLLYSTDMKKIRLAPAYDIVSTVIYEGSTKNMALSIGGNYDIYKISRESFEKEAKDIGIGQSIAMKHFDDMCNKFEKTLLQSGRELENLGFFHAQKLADRILSKRK